jgi:hypothetical protein
MVPDGFIAAFKRHVAVLPFTGIKKDVLFSPSIFVPVLLSGFAAEQIIGADAGVEMPPCC